MTERLAVRLEIVGQLEHQREATHTLRHLAMRAGWRFTKEASRRLIYASVDDPRMIAQVTPEDVVILSSPQVTPYIDRHGQWQTLAQDIATGLPFPHPRGDGLPANWVVADVVIAAHLVMNLYYEHQHRATDSPQWIRFSEDWWPLAGLDTPTALADDWLQHITRAAIAAGWPHIEKTPGTAPYSLLLSHDVDYLPGRYDLGLPRLIRALARQLLTRHRPNAALRVAGRYLRRIADRPYWEIPRIISAEHQYQARSSFQFTVAPRHPKDPAYRLTAPRIKALIRQSAALGAEICLHGSYAASNHPGQLKVEKTALERALGTPIQGHRQHYLSFHPARLFKQLQQAGFRYDLSIGYNDIPGPRAGTHFPYRPFDPIQRSEHGLWEFPFSYMDTTLALSCGLSADAATEQVNSGLNHALHHGGVIGIIWHQEQLGGLLDPGFEQAYFNILDHAHSHNARLISAGDLLSELDIAWQQSAAPGALPC